MGVEEEKPIYVAIQGEVSCHHYSSTPNWQLHTFHLLSLSRPLPSLTQVYDVTDGKSFYGPEGVYGSFAGHDVTRAFALNSLDEKDLDDLK